MLGPHPADLAISERDASALLVEECGDHHYEVATVGMQSNVAAALADDPSFAGDVPRLTGSAGFVY